MVMLSEKRTGSVIGVGFRDLPAALLHQFEGCPNLHVGQMAKWRMGLEHAGKLAQVVSGHRSVPDPILAAIEAHKAAFAALENVQQRFSEFETELHANERLQYERRTEDESRRGDDLEAAPDRAYNIENAAAVALLGAEVTTTAGMLALLQHVQKYDDDTYGEGWPVHLMDDDVEGTRPWHYYLIVNLIRDLPAIMRGAV
jgi:hypothetical protein